MAIGIKETVSEIDSITGINGSKTLFVDAFRTNTYVEDGSIVRPFKTIQAAINQIITNADNVTFPYLIDIIGAGSYPENLVLNNLALYDITFEGHLLTTITPVAGNSIDSSSNNANLQHLIFNGITFGKDILLSSTVDGGVFGNGGILFYDCFLLGTNTVTNVGVIYFYDTTVGALPLTNVKSANLIGSATIQGSGFTLVTNNAAPKPVGFFGCFALSRNAFIGSNINVGAGSFFNAFQGSMIGLVGGTLTVDGFCNFFDSLLQANSTVNNAAFLTLNNTVNSGTVTENAGSTFTNNFTVESIRIGEAVAAANTRLVFLNGHLKSTQTTAPTVTVNPNAGTGAVSSVSNATDSAGNLSLTTGAVATSAGVQTTVNFNKAYNVAPIVNLTATNANVSLDTVLKGIFVTSTVNGFSVNFSAVNLVATTYTWSYQVIETQ